MKDEWKIFIISTEPQVTDLRQYGKFSNDSPIHDQSTLNNTARHKDFKWFMCVCWWCELTQPSGFSLILKFALGLPLVLGALLEGSTITRYPSVWQI